MSKLAEFLIKSGCGQNFNVLCMQINILHPFTGVSSYATGADHIIMIAFTNVYQSTIFGRFYVA